MATSLSSMGGMGGSCGLQQRDPATAAAYPSYMFAHHGADPLSSLQSSYNQHQRAAAAAAACSAAQASSVAASAHSYAAATSAHAQTGNNPHDFLFVLLSIAFESFRRKSVFETKHQNVKRFVHVSHQMLYIV